MLHTLRHRCFRFKNCSAFSLSSVNDAKSASHYDVLGITPHANQSEIKSAYYKLSKMYHPDKNEGSDEALQKFRDITAAYEVLGNYRLRKLYDKGLIHIADSGSRAKREEDDDGQTRFYKSRLKRDKPPTATGRTPIYNFDEWSEAHYGETFARQKKARENHLRKVDIKSRNAGDIKSEITMWGIGLICMSFYLMSHYSQVDHDVVDDDDQKDDT